ncbi:PucR family transcriptional regulator [Microbacterium sp. SGAir0570]|uniref:PucR family transcriptional regulator n=1 Tax=Microbacterium sp. SGAir0570 TaxID=2070348 RepID=UPI0010CCE2DC|nr:helix-turn-helix domain-containing protein [Microbacterium sp. SGAir0570]QCR40083.1 PucR family transcriptional regulator [Microbacterium sp. SGAir0570]
MTDDSSKAETLAWLRRISGDLATATINRLEETLPWYAEMPPARRSSVGLVAQAGITSFIQWYEDPTSTPRIAADIFAAAPRELLRSVSLTQTLQLVRVTVEVTEERVAHRGDDVREAILKYSRDVAFAAADVYARAAEARGLWDARLEALVVDSILTGETDEELPSRIAALGWHGHGAVAVLVGTAPPQFDVDQLRRAARKMGVDVLVGVQGLRLVLVIGRADLPGRVEPVSELTFLEIAARLEPGFGPGHLVLGPTVPALVDASQSARAALAGFAVAGAWRHAPRPVEADDLLPERALAGDPVAKATLVERIYRPLLAHSADLVATLWSYLDNGRSLEATARELFVHPNTVRYRLKRVSDVIGWDATGPREALILQTALILGSIGNDLTRRRAPQSRRS